MATRKRATRTAAAPAHEAVARLERAKAAAEADNAATDSAGAGTETRTEEDILLQRPIEVTLAGKTYDIALLPIRAQAEWRR